MVAMVALVAPAVPARPAMAAIPARFTLTICRRFRPLATDLTALLSLPWAGPASVELVAPAAAAARASEALAVRVARAALEPEVSVALVALAEPRLECSGRVAR